MCGICGKIVFNGAVVDEKLISAMCRTMVHRGPDEEGVFTAPHVGLGQRRLSIIDLSTSATPPLANEDKTVHVVLNGEIYNFQNIRQDLIEKGHRFSSQGDTEVIVHLYEEHGVDCLQYLRGMFSFALWDDKKKMLFAARDRMGKKPFCFAVRKDSFVFGSEIRAVLTDPDISAAPNFQALDLYLSHACVPAPYTAFEGVEKLPAGHFLTCSAGGELNVKAYWRPPAPFDCGASESEIQQELFRLLQESVRLRMVSDVPIGALLSGGIDSTAIVALMAREGTDPIKTFSIGFNEDAYNELPYAKLLAERYGTEHHEFVVKPDIIELLPLLVRHYNEPFGDASAIPTFYVSKMARQYVTVALSGDGGDESFSGYGVYGKMLRWEQLNAIPHSLRYATSLVGNAILKLFPGNNTAARFHRGFLMLRSDLKGRYLLERMNVKPNEKDILYSERFKALLTEGGKLTDPSTCLPYCSKMDSIVWMLRHDQGNYLPDCLMVKSDIAAMANSLELRCPLLDHKIVEFAAGIPSRLKRDGGIGKMILKNTVAHLLPDEILSKRKTGFGVPIGDWFRHELAGLLKETLLSERFNARALFKPEVVERMVKEHISGKRLWTNRLWLLFMMELWFREYID